MIWGGRALSSLLGKDFSPLPNCGESWELSGMPGQVSVVRNGFLAGNSLEECIEVYMGELVGEQVFGRHGHFFPLLFKFIDTDGLLSVQVHPDDAFAAREEKSLGKRECWYVLGARPDAEILLGFKQDMDRESLRKHLEAGSLREIMNTVKPEPGDVFEVPPGRIHAIGAGVTLCEIQQASDITYRVYDWGRTATDGKARELHMEKALQVLDYQALAEPRILYENTPNRPVPLLQSPDFSLQFLEFNQMIQLDYFYLDSFVVYVCLEGAARINHPNGVEEVRQGECVLLPAELKTLSMQPMPRCRLLETYIA